MARRPLFELPRLREDENLDQERKVSWLELFYDLVFVVTVAELAHKLSADYTFSTFYKFIFLFIPVWWVWIGSTYYNERFETQGLENRIFYLAKMIAIAAVAVFIHDAMGETSAQFALAYAGARFIILAMWARATYYSKPFRPVGYRIVIGFTASIILFVASAYVDPPLRFILWGIGLTIDLLTPLTTLKKQRHLPKLSTSKLPERFGLFLIIVLGESIVGVVKGMAMREHIDSHMVVNFLMGIILTFGIWWIYFDFIGRRPPKHGTYLNISWTYLHLPLVIFITAIGAGVQQLVSNDSHFVESEVSILISLCLGLSLITLGLLETTLHRHQDEPTHKFWSPAIKLITGIFALILMIFSFSLDLHLLMSFMILFVLINMFYGAYAWFCQNLNEEK